jgi:hypothetical protein
MADSNTTASKSMEVDKDKKAEEPQPQMGVLEEDDEFEEFAVQGKPPTRVLSEIFALF